MFPPAIRSISTWCARGMAPGARIRKSIVPLLVVLSSSVLLASPPRAAAKPTFGFSFPFPGFSLSGLVGGAGGASQKRSAPGVKPYSGLRLENDSLVMVYWHDQTVAVVELGPDKLLLNCELIEVYDDDDRSGLLEQLSKMNKPLHISLKKMIKLMSQCHQVEGLERVLSPRRSSRAGPAPPQDGDSVGRGLENSPLSLLSGIIPGTKWCGTGDIASTYHDLGPERNMDRCCRSHDLCPVKVRAFSQRYNLTNNSLYSKSHCLCDDALFSCLKETNTSASQVMGNIYFNLVKVPCVQERGHYRTFRQARQGF